MKTWLVFTLFAVGWAILFWMTWGHDLRYTVPTNGGNWLEKPFSTAVCIIVTSLVGAGGGACTFLILFLVRRLRGKPL
jgi:hypothetical protein